PPGDALGADPLTARPGDIIAIGGCAEVFTFVELWTEGADGPSWERIWWFDNTTNERGDWPSDQVPEFTEARCVDEIHEFEIPGEAVPGWYRVDAQPVQVLAET
ncbi:MAG: hypothetical protein QNJ88_15745, partial [Acidimicrobiia bacterium]|nr:hypothetical protein [Acidimicrobiia bacterium]